MSNNQLLNNVYNKCTAIWYIKFHNQKTNLINELYKNLHGLKSSIAKDRYTSLCKSLLNDFFQDFINEISKLKIVLTKSDKQSLSLKINEFTIYLLEETKNDQRIQQALWYSDFEKSLLGNCEKLSCQLENECNLINHNIQINWTKITAIVAIFTFLVQIIINYDKIQGYVSLLKSP
ncbi:MAG: hypothetical protein PHC64_01600 [Candidatus Gastranaerophilales bacterium]|nr:hypothetical protein [Candidatus Gastranaerophilales bacterium]